MSVYVDSYGAKFRTMRMSHMTADTLRELHEMARIIGLKREWFQNGRYPHYDVCQSKRQLAIDRGALTVESAKIVEVAKTLKEAANEPGRD